MNESIVPERKNEINELVSALAKAQLEIKSPKKDKVNPMFKSKYSSLDAIYEACREPLAKFGLVVSHSVEFVNGVHTLVTTLRHVSGQSIVCSVPMFVDKLTSQGFGSALTYSRRYSICSLLSLPSDEDDDGNAAEEAKPAGKKLNYLEIEKIQDVIGNDQELLANLLKVHNAKNLNELVGDFNFILKNLKAAKGIK